MYTEKLTLVQPTPEYAANTCGPYWYLIQSHGTASNAFCRRESFLNWLQERNLTLEHDLVDQGIHNFQKIIGSYREISHSSYDEFYALNFIKQTRKLDNGRYTLAFIVEGEDGLREVHYMNCNCKFRIEYDYHESRSMYG